MLRSGLCEVLSLAGGQADIDSIIARARHGEVLEAQHRT
jgi:hypothetical protein